MKAILVIDMPSSCKDCSIRFTDSYSDYCPCNRQDVFDYANNNTKPDWCPLKPMPEKMQVCGKYPQPDGIVPSYKIGYNACIDEILGDKE